MITVTKSDGPSVVHRMVDLGFRTAYRVAHRMLRIYWSIRHPHTEGALIAVWSDGELLVVKNSYRRHYTLPGGYLRRGESVEEAGARELCEECGVTVPASEIRLGYRATKQFEHRNDQVNIVEVELKTRPRIVVDNREVVWAGFKLPEAVRNLPIVPHLRDYLDYSTGRHTSAC
jgi:8-oxo-dGTP diphosphatase